MIEVPPPIGAIRREIRGVLGSVRKTLPQSALYLVDSKGPELQV